MARRIKKKVLKRDTIKCQIYNEIDSDGIDEYRFRIYDHACKIILSSSTRYYQKSDAIAEMETAVEYFKNDPESIRIETTESGERYYFNVVDPTGEVVARRITYYNSISACRAEIDRVREILRNNAILITEKECGDNSGGSSEPCIRDKDICDLHDHILDLYKRCFPDEVPDLKGEYFCAKEIVELIRHFHSTNASYNLLEVLDTEIRKIDQFIANIGSETFVLAKGGVLNIINYLYKRGNCHCEGPFEISENASIQSSHLYLQAAGSKGVDSTEGVHLRWMLKDKLANHLPKADYAASSANFNKPDDYVRIYRTPYVEHKFRLNLQERPYAVDNSSSSWTYSISGEVFYVYFLNTAKYNQVLASFNPLTQPTDFIKSYGNNVIEIEHKTELSFAITPVLEMTGSGSKTRLELLSVENNILTAPKVASLRKEFNTVSLSNRKILSENIRSIRLKVSNGFIASIEFESYSRFIENVNRKDAWSLMGKYALTKDTPTAFQRLEPVANTVHGKWWRYNDGANVNINNYKEKWNGTSLPVENRILSAVDTYIDLSNDPTNPTAIESFLINDASTSTDPDYDPSDNEFDLSNLFVLQMASLDYHVARMLGLGTLDMDSSVVRRKYMYLAEYITVADLEDGLGARKVQHLFCSLPTASTDERLPLPIDLKELVPGITQGIGTETPTVITDTGGYSHDGKTRFLTLFNEDLPEELEDQIFYYTNYEFVSALSTIPVYAGIEYKRQVDADWKKPELPNDTRYLNIDSTVPNNQKYETLSIAIPESGFPLFVHREKDNGWHDYSSYGINWFSRSTRSGIIRQIETVISPTNSLQPPTNVNAVLVRKESPLLLSSADEQSELDLIGSTDKTFIRLTFEYHHGQELINYHKEINGDLVSGYAELPDADELFGEDFEIYFRNRTPISVAGKIIAVVNNANPILADIETGDFVLASTGTPPDVISPSIIGDGSNFIGSIITVNGENYRIHQIDNSGTFPKFTVFKNDSDGFPVSLGSTIPPSDLTIPSTGGMFLGVENMLTDTNWSLPDPTVSTTLPSPLPSPLTFKVNIDHTTVNREEITIALQDGTVETHVQKFRGIYENALIEEQLEDHDGNALTADIHHGLYKITFTGYSLAQHSQSALAGHRVEWYNGVLRIHTQNDSTGARKELKVIRTENIGTTNDLIVYAADLSFDLDASYDKVEIGTHTVNYYPGYKAYLFHDSAHNLTENQILPALDEGVRYSIFGLRTHDHGLGFYSKISQPILMFAQEIVEPEKPRLPVGGLYATRPDFFGKASYTFKTVYEHKPYSVQFNRASDIQILATLYKADTPSGSSDYNVDSVMLDYFANRKDEWLQDRWNNLIGWDYNYSSAFSTDGQFEVLPDTADGIALPMPNNPNFIASINAFIDGHNLYFSQSISNISSITSLHTVIIPSGTGYNQLTILDFMRDIIFNCFVPLTEIPVIYKHIKPSTYKPVPKKQNIRDRDGNLLSPNHADFDMAPMMKITATGSPNHETQFTDFGLDGSSNALYFYSVREINMQMKNSPYSPILGPITLVNSAPPKAPEIVKITPVLGNQAFGIVPGIEIQLNGYAKSQNIVKINVYRAMASIDSLSIRTMDMVSEIDVVTANIQADKIWTIKDDFSDLGYVPYGDPLYYKIVVQREIKYYDKDMDPNVDPPKIDIAPSDASKLTLTNIVENSNPEAPALSYYATAPNAAFEVDSVTLSWTKTVHNGSYTIHKMNTSGNWEQIHEVQTNDALIQIPLVDTTLASNILLIEDTDGKKIYHHFKIIAKNFAGMISREEKILTIYNADTWQDIATI